MTRRLQSAAIPRTPRYYLGVEVPSRVIRAYAQQVARQFRPDRIVLFGSHAYGTPNSDSDVDLLVVMPARNELDQAVRIHQALLPPFPLDLIVHTPRNLSRRLAQGDSFLKEITAKGRVLYESADAGLGPQGRSRPHHGSSRRGKLRAAS